MPKPPTIIDMDTGEVLKLNTESQNKRRQKNKNGTSKTSKVATAASVASGAVIIGTAIWQALTPEQKQTIINGGKKAIQSVAGWFKKKATSNSNTNQNIIPTSGGQYTIINRPTDPTRKKKGVTAIPPLF